MCLFDDEKCFEIVSWEREIKSLMIRRTLLQGYLEYERNLMITNFSLITRQGEG